MNKIQRNSPIVFKARPLKKEKTDNWEVVMEYENEGQGPYIIDLSHKPRFDLQSCCLADKKPFGINLPEVPGNCVLENGVLVNRMNKTQVSIFNLTGGEDIRMPDQPEYTDVTEATLCIALIGRDVFSICEKLTSLDFMDPQKSVPFLFQGPFSHVPCQIITLNKDGDNKGLILTCSRGYGRDMIHAILHAGEEFRLLPAGENRFTKWIKEVKI